MGAVLKGVKIIHEPVELGQKEREGAESLDDELEKEHQEDVEHYKREAESIIEDARKEAEAILSSAREKAEKLFNEASRRLDEIRAESDKYIEEYRQKGYKEGIEKAKEEVEKKFLEEIEELRQKLNMITSSVLDIREDVLYKSEECIIRLLLLMLRKIVKKEIEIDKGFVLRNIEAVLEKVSKVAKVRLRLNPMDADIVLSSNVLNGRVEIVKDESIDKGGCVAETDFGDLDAQISTQLSEMEKVIMTTLREGRGVV